MDLPPEHIAPDGRLVCQECGQALHRLATHIAIKHGVNPDAYRERYGLNRTAPLSSDAVRAKFSAHAREQNLAALATPITRERRRADLRLSRPGRPYRDQGRATLSAAQTGSHHLIRMAQERCKACGTEVTISINNAGRRQGVMCATCRAEWNRQKVRAWREHLRLSG